MFDSLNLEGGLLKKSHPYDLYDTICHVNTLTF